MFPLACFGLYEEEQTQGQPWDGMLLERKEDSVMPDMTVEKVIVETRKQRWKTRCVISRLRTGFESGNRKANG